MNVGEGRRPSEPAPGVAPLEGRPAIPLARSALVATTLVWTASNVLVKKLYALGLQPGFITAMRFSLSALLMSPFVKRTALSRIGWGLFGAYLMLTSILFLPSEADARAGVSTDIDSDVRAVMLCQELMEPLPRYIADASWDKARSNVNYCTRNLRLKKAMEAVTEKVLALESDVDAADEGIIIANELNDVFTQLDASLYTPIFIVSDSGISDEQRKYADEALMYWGEVRASLRRFLELLPPELEQRNVEAVKSIHVPLGRETVALPSHE